VTCAFFYMGGVQTFRVTARLAEPVYVRIAENAKHLRVLGMSDTAIGVSDKTVAKTIALSAD
jgi:hypothetical protein